jgi:guanine deaminase
MPGQHAHFMQEAIRLAEQGMKSGNGGPFGAVIVRNERIIGSGWNRVLATNDPTAHAEIVAIRDACERTGSYWLEGCRIYVSCEPCPMCLAAVYWARIEELVYAATRKDAAAIEFADDRIYREICLPAGKRSLNISQCLRPEALQVMQKWLTLEEKRPY